jgi:hypothetical protein
LNVDDDLGLLEFLVHPRQLGFQFAVLLGQGVAGGFAAALLGQRAESARVAQAPPLDQVGRVQPLAPQQSADRARIAGAVGFLDDAQLILGGELATLGFGHDFGIGSRRHRGSPRVGGPSATGGLAPLALPALQGRQLDHAGISIELQIAYHDVSSLRPLKGQ